MIPMQPILSRPTRITHRLVSLFCFCCPASSRRPAIVSWALCRLAEAFAEKIHLDMRVKYWGYAKEEHLEATDLHKVLPPPPPRKGMVWCCVCEGGLCVCFGMLVWQPLGHAAPTRHHASLASFTLPCPPIH